MLFSQQNACHLVYTEIPCPQLHDVRDIVQSENAPLCPLDLWGSNATTPPPLSQQVEYSDWS
jgi:hypothetical protein